MQNKRKKSDPPKKYLEDFDISWKHAVHLQLGLGMRDSFSESMRTGSPPVLTRWSLSRPQLRTKAGVKIKIIAIAEEKNCTVYNRRN